MTKEDTGSVYDPLRRTLVGVRQNAVRFTWRGGKLA